MLFDVLPTELALSVIGYIEQRWWICDAAQLALVSKSFNRIFTPILYRTVVLSNARALTAFYHLVEPHASNPFFGRALAFISRPVSHRQRERHAILIQLVRNMSIWYASSKAVHMDMARAIICACPALASLQLTPAMSLAVVLRNVPPVRRLCIADNAQGPSFLVEPDHTFLGTHLHLMDIGYLALQVNEDSPPDTIRGQSFPNLTSFSTTCEKVSESRARSVAAAIREILRLPRMERLVVRVRLAQGADVAGTHLWRALHALADSRVYMLSVPPWMPLLASIVELEMWRRTAAGLEDLWSAGASVWRPSAQRRIGTGRSST